MTAMQYEPAALGTFRALWGLARPVLRIVCGLFGAACNIIAAAFGVLGFILCGVANELTDDEEWRL